MFLSIFASAADVAINPYDMSIVLTNDWIGFFINGNPISINGLRSLLRYPPTSIILEICVFDKLLSAEKLYAFIIIMACLILELFFGIYIYVVN